MSENRKSASQIFKIADYNKNGTNDTTPLILFSESSHYCTTTFPPPKMMSNRINSNRRKRKDIKATNGIRINEAENEDKKDCNNNWSYYNSLKKLREQIAVTRCIVIQMNIKNAIFMNDGKNDDSNDTLSDAIKSSLQSLSGSTIKIIVR